MTPQEFRTYLINKKQAELAGVEGQYRIKELEKRIESLKKSLLSASGWSEKELIRSTLKQNEELLVKMKRQFNIDQL
jgi:inorganic pyrophosphatase/exopolyphosphatase